MHSNGILSTKTKCFRMLKHSSLLRVKGRSDEMVSPRTVVQNSQTRNPCIFRLLTVLNLNPEWMLACNSDRHKFQYFSSKMGVFDKVFVWSNLNHPSNRMVCTWFVDMQLPYSYLSKCVTFVTFVIFSHFYLKDVFKTVWYRRPLSPKIYVIHQWHFFLNLKGLSAV